MPVQPRAKPSKTKKMSVQRLLRSKDKEGKQDIDTGNIGTNFNF